MRILAAATDITERKRAEEALRESRVLLQLVANVVPVMIAYADTEQRYRFVNRGYLEWFGLAEGAIIDREMRELFGEQLFMTIERYVVPRSRDRWDAAPCANRRGCEVLPQNSRPSLPRRSR